MALSLDGTTGLSASGNITGGNIVSTGTISVAGALTVGSFSPSSLSTAGNITGNYILGNGSQLVGLPAGYTNANLASLGSNVISTSGNITGGYLFGNASQLTGLPAGYTNANLASLGSNAISTTGSVSAGDLSVTGNIGTGGNVVVSGYISATGNLYVANIISSQTLVVDDPLVYFNANITYPYNYDIGFFSAFVGGTGNTYQHTGFVRDFSDSIWKLVSNVPEPSGSDFDFTNAIYDTIKTGNIISVGTVSSTGNITGSYIVGNGSQLTGLPAGYTNSNLASLGSNVISTSGNITGGNLNTPGIVSATGNITAATFTGSNVSVTGTITGGSNITGGNLRTAGSVSATGAVIGGTLSTTGAVLTGTISATGAVVVDGSLSATGMTVFSPGLLVAGGIQNGGANGVGNIGSSTTYFNTVFAKATSAQYADLAEMYCADAAYPPGTVLDFGGTEEVTATTKSHSTQVAGIVSTQPSYLMNSALDCADAVEVALVGRVPCQVVGTIAKGDRLVASDIPGVATCLDMAQYQPGCIIGKALEAYNSTTVGTIEVAVGRL